MNDPHITYDLFTSKANNVRDAIYKLIDSSKLVEEINMYKHSLEMVNSIQELVKIGHMYEDAGVIMLGNLIDILGIEIKEGNE